MSLEKERLAVTSIQRWIPQLYLADLRRPACPSSEPVAKLEPDLLWLTVHFLQSMGADVRAAVTTTKSPLLEQLPVETVTIGDLEDFEQLAVGSDLLIGNSHLAAVSQRLQVPLYRLGFPIFDRLGNGQRCTVGYRGVMQMLFDLGNLFLEQEEAQTKH
ncbi:nitrogenase component 1 [Leptolyngbya sp. 7M]|uniref:nitrogenase component 1 n=1 Tax=Leptolyngbya sp. 7M TaxID=2812896 RepID=UPI0021F1A939|nr:nitrogenase component 1 [Leptolyngbya sp. 7M]